ncbi:MAG: hypothetical protein VXZ73_02640 [Pseudomonadota bacterium]|nr:hypothetical protein [Pseudomonadota bacterium]
MSEVLRQILKWIKSDQTVEHEAGLLALSGWVAANKDTTELDFSECELGKHAVSVCEHLRGLSKLTTLILSENYFVGGYAVAACKYLSELPCLTTLCLSGSELHEHTMGVVNHLCAMPMLTSLDFSYTCSGGLILDVCKRLGKLKGLTEIHLGGNDLGFVDDTVEACKHLGNLKSLTTLSLDGNQLGKKAVEVCAQLSNLTNLTTLNLMQNDLGEYAVDTCKILSKLPKLTTLGLRMNDLEEHAVAACEFLSEAPNLTSLDLAWNNLNKYAIDVSRQLSQLSILTELDLVSNRLSEHAEIVCRTFLKPYMPITLRLYCNTFTEDIKTKCLEVVQENQNLLECGLEERMGAIWLNSLFHKRFDAQQISIKEVGISNEEQMNCSAESTVDRANLQPKELEDQSSMPKRLATGPALTLFDIPGPLIKSITEEYARPVAPLQIHG